MSNLFVQPTLFVGFGPAGGRGYDDLINETERERERDREIFWTYSLNHNHMLDPCCNGPYLDKAQVKQSHLCCVLDK